MKKNLLFLCCALTGIISQAQVTTTFNYTGAVQTYTVPCGVTSVTIQASGAQGGNASIGGTGGLGGTANGILTVSTGDILYIYVGGQNGYNGGGTGGQDGNTTFGGLPGNLAPSGGGASDVRWNGISLANRVIVAGGGGGAGSNGVWPGCQVAGPAGNGGNGGGLTGVSGTFGVGTPCNCAGGGGDGASGGTQSAGGIHGNYFGNTACFRSSWGPGGDGSVGLGGNGSLQYHNGTGGGGGGGGGYYGGGSGGNGSDTTPGGGGGSSWLGTLTSTSTTAGNRSGNGVITITASNSGSAPASPTSISGSAVICEGTTTTYSISSVVGASSYTWTVPVGTTINSGQGTTSISVTLGASSGVITVTANNCIGNSAPTSFSVTVNPLPIISITPANPTICNGINETLLASGAANYSWSSGGTTAAEIVSPTSNTTYTVTGTDANGCINTASTTVFVNQLPIVIATPNTNSVCSGFSDVITGSGALTYSWSSGGTATTETVTPTSTTTYTLTGIDANGCVGTTTFTIIANPLPTINVTASADPICVGSSSTLTANGANSFVWAPSGGTSSTEIVAPSSTATYTVTGTDANGCVNSNTITVTVNQLPIVDLGIDITQCGGSATLDAGTNGINYLWSDNSTTQTITVSTSGTYSVIVTDAFGCSNASSVNVTINANPTVTGTASSTSVCLNDGNVSLTGSPAGGTWSGPGVTGTSFAPATAGNGAQTLSYNFTDVNGCTGTATVIVMVNACTGINNFTNNSGINVFPNPSNGNLTINSNYDAKEMFIVITDLAGRVVFTNSIKNVIAGSENKINLVGVASGVYTLNISSEKFSSSEHITIEK